MRHLFYPLILLFGFLLSSCTSTNEVLLNEYEEIIGSTPNTSKNGVYTWNINSDKAVLKETPLKEKTDKELGMLPTIEKKLQVSPSTGDYFSSYVWESPEFRVVLYMDYQKNKQSIQLVFKEK